VVPDSDSAAESRPAGVKQRGFGDGTAGELPERVGRREWDFRRGIVTAMNRIGFLHHFGDYTRPANS
jgi:hypothetical protein